MGRIAGILLLAVFWAIASMGAASAAERPQTALDYVKASAAQQAKADSLCFKGVLHSENSLLKYVFDFRGRYQKKSASQALISMENTAVLTGKSPLPDQMNRTEKSQSYMEIDAARQVYYTKAGDKISKKTVRVPQHKRMELERAFEPDQIQSARIIRQDSDDVVVRITLNREKMKERLKEDGGFAVDAANPAAMFQKERFRLDTDRWIDEAGAIKMDLTIAKRTARLKECSVDLSDLVGAMLRQYQEQAPKENEAMLEMMARDLHVRVSVQFSQYNHAPAVVIPQEVKEQAKEVKAPAQEIKAKQEAKPAAPLL